MRSDDWLGQKAPLPNPSSALSANACQASWMSGKSEIATAITVSEPTSVCRGPMRSLRRPGQRPGHQRGHRVRRGDQARQRQREAAHVVQVDDQERDDDPVAEEVREPSQLEQPDRARQLRVQAAEIAPHRPSLAMCSGG